MENFRGLVSNRESFPANNKIMQPRNFSAANDLHYTVAQYIHAYACITCMAIDTVAQYAMVAILRVLSGIILWTYG